MDGKLLSALCGEVTSSQFSQVSLLDLSPLSEFKKMWLSLVDPGWGELAISSVCNIRGLTPAFKSPPSTSGLSPVYYICFSNGNFRQCI